VLVYANGGQRKAANTEDSKSIELYRSVLKNKTAGMVRLVWAWRVQSRHGGHGAARKVRRGEVDQGRRVVARSGFARQGALFMAGVVRLVVDGQVRSWLIMAGKF
jgi:hypothetical protein